MFKHILLISNNYAKVSSDTMNTVITLLEKRGIGVVLDEYCSKLADRTGPKHITTESFENNGYDLAIAIGGDGTMLRAAHVLANHDIPLLGINSGRLGFLADIPANEVEDYLAKILDGNFVEDERFQLHAQISRDGEIILESDAFNDIIIQKWNIAKLIEFETYVDGTYVHNQRGDGMIVSSPTGSTAYALAASGPIVHPSLDALLIVPICPHTLTNRPIVIDGNSKIEIILKESKIEQCCLTCDGEVISEFRQGDKLTITKKDKKIRLIHPLKHDHFSTLRAKLDWG